MEKLDITWRVLFKETIKNEMSFIQTQVMTIQQTVKSMWSYLHLFILKIVV